MKKILGLDLGTNSIGWALIEQDFDKKEGSILGLGSRIIPMDQRIIGDFEKGNSISQTEARTTYRGSRRLRERHLLRRERLHRVLNVLEFLPKHYANQIDFTKRLGQFINESEPKLAYNEAEFIFRDSFEEMLGEFKIHQPSLVNRKNRNGENALIPYDWTIYFLRKKALNNKISKEELAWLLLNFNQKRGYFQLRGEEEEENPNKLVEYHSLKVVKVEADAEPNKRGDLWYSLHLENGWIYRRSSKMSLADWQDKIRDFIVTTDLNDDGTIKLDKDGDAKRSFRAPKDEDWTLMKKKTEHDIEKSSKTVGAYIYDTLLQVPNQKIRGKLIRTIERKYYKDELIQILKKQIELQPELFTNDKLNDCVRELYKNNENHQQQLLGQDFIHLFVNDIIFYQRPLKSQKSNIGRCGLEYRKYKRKDNEGKTIEITDYLRAIPKSHPLFQEFRIWQWLYNLKVFLKEDDSNITAEFLQSIKSYEEVFEFLMDRKEIKQDALIKFLLKDKGFKGKALNKEAEKYRWNYVEDKVYPCNETRTLIKTRLTKTDGVDKEFLTEKNEIALWHIIYSVMDKIEFEKALATFAAKNGLDIDSFVENFKRFPSFKSDYGAFSARAIKKLLPLIRLGKYWSWEDIHAETKQRIDKILTGEYDETIKTRVREKAIHLQKHEDFQGLQLWLAQYIVYDRHSEANIIGKWNSVNDLESYLNDFRQHSLRNPIVEQVVTETLQVVKDIWKHYGEGKKDFFDEIHIELGRDMKNTADDRKRITQFVTENEKTNTRIKAFLTELFEDSSVESVRPHSPIQQELLKIYEDGVLNSGVEVPEEISKISKTEQPTKAQFQKYKLWLEQRYKSPYTGQVIPLNKLFTIDYEIEHVIPKSRYFDDSFTNKVICESAINSLKDRQLGLEFVKNHGGQKVEIRPGKLVEVLKEDAYREFVKIHYQNNHQKRNKLLMEEIPEKMISRQLNDTRYISKFISNLLSNIVREDDNDDGYNSKNILPGNGKVTSQLRHDWGLNDVWNQLMLPRFERMNELTNSIYFTAKNSNGQLIPTVPLDLAKGFQKKRLDHRHHALDALVIACATRNHINLLNNQHAKTEHSRYDLQHKLRNYENYINNKGETKIRFTTFYKPWNTFTVDAKDVLEKIVISFKQNLRVINKATNKYEKIVNGKKIKVEQKGLNWAIRKPMHKDTVSGKINLPWVKLPKGKIITASRKTLDPSFNFKNIRNITDTGIQKILQNYLESKANNPEIAFSPEGIEDMNKNITLYNNGKFHHPIYKVRVFETGSKFPLGETGNKKDKYVETAKGTNLFFAIYQDEYGKRDYETIPLNIVIERQKQGLDSVPEKNEKGYLLLFYLSPNDLVYVPREAESFDSNIFYSENIYKMVSSTGKECHFIPANISLLIKNYDAKSKIGEIGSLNKQELTLDLSNPIRIKEKCIKLKVDRLGNVSIAPQNEFLG